MPDPQPDQPTTSGAKFWNHLRKRRNWRVGVLILGGVGLLLVIVGALFIVIRVVPAVWDWGFHRTIWNLQAYGLATLSIVGCFFLYSFAPIFPVYLGSLVWQVISLYFEDADVEIKQRLDRTKEAQRQVEENLQTIEEGDATGLIQLARYSRLQLEQYYDIGLRQTQQSFRYSVVAMWIGFVVMIGGMAPFLIPLFQRGSKVNSSFSINALVLAGGVVIELISALFLWVYRNSIAQLTYFYNRQIHLHNVLMCFRISVTMKTGDEAKSLDARSMIIQKVLDSAWTLERPEAPSSKGIKDLLGGVPAIPTQIPSATPPVR